MNKLNFFFVIIMIVGLILIILARSSKQPILVAITGYIIIFLSTIGYSLNGGK